MSTTSPAQTSFIGGEISPRLRGRFGSDLYRAALAFCENWEITPQGSIRRRAGTVYAGDLTGLVDASVRILPVRLSRADDFLAVLGDRVMRLYAIDGSSASSGFIALTDLLTNGDFAGGLAGWTTTAPGIGQSITGTGGRAVFRWPHGAFGSWPWWIRQQITLADPTDLTLRFSILNYQHETSTVTVKVGTTLGGSELYLLADAKPTTVQASLGTVPAGDVFVSIEPYSSAAALDVGDVLGFDVEEVSLSASTGENGEAIVTPWGADQLRDAQVVSETGTDRVIFVHPNYPPYELKRSAFGAWNFNEITFSTPPAEWAGSNWPGVGEMRAGRLWLGGTPNEGNRLWASRVGSPFDFDTMTGSGGTVSLPEDALDYRIATKGALRWLLSGRAFLIGTDLSEHTIAGLIVQDLEIREESAWGSAPLQAVHAGTHALYVSGDRRKVRALNYEQQTDGWDSRDVTFTGEHLTAETIKEIHFAGDPSSTILLLLEDGTVAACTTDLASGVTAWWRLVVPGATILSAAVIRSELGAVVWMAVQRGASIYLEQMPLHEAGAAYCDSAVTRDAPAANPQTSQESATDAPYADPVPGSYDVGTEFTLAAGNPIFGFNIPSSPARVGLDLVFEAGGRLRVVAWTSFNEATVRVVEDLAAPVQAGLAGPTLLGGVDWHWEWGTVVQGLAHLEGETVELVLDGIHDGQKVVAGGAITIDRPGEVAVIGLPYTATARTLPPEAGNPRGTAQGSKRRFARIFARLADSALPKLNGNRPPDRTPATPQNEAEPRMSGDIDVASLGWGDGTITIEQDLPLRTEVLAVFGVLATNQV